MNDTLEDVKQFLEHKNTLRSRLEADIFAARAHLRDLDDALTQIDGPADRAPVTVGDVLRDLAPAESPRAAESSPDVDPVSSVETVAAAELSAPERPPAPVDQPARPALEYMTPEQAILGYVHENPGVCLAKIAEHMENLGESRTRAMQCTHDLKKARKILKRGSCYFIAADTQSEAAGPRDSSTELSAAAGGVVMGTILEFVTANPGCALGEIADHLATTRSTRRSNTFACVDRMVKKGQIKNVMGQYAVPGQEIERRTSANAEGDEGADDGGEDEGQADDAAPEDDGEEREDEDEEDEKDEPEEEEARPPRAPAPRATAPTFRQTPTPAAVRATKPLERLPLPGAKRPEPPPPAPTKPRASPTEMTELQRYRMRNAQGGRVY